MLVWIQTAKTGRHWAAGCDELMLYIMCRRRQVSCWVEDILEVNQEISVGWGNCPYCTEEAASAGRRCPLATAGDRWDDGHGAGVDELARGGINHQFKMFEKIYANNCKTDIC